jgi:hypothetical protein
MSHPSILDHFHMPAEIRHGFAPSLRFHPLAVVAAPAANVEACVVIGYDYVDRDRAVKNVPRVKSNCTHVNITLIAGDGTAPVTVGFGAACLQETIAHGSFVRLHPDLRLLAESIYGVLDNLSAIPTLLHPSLKRCVPGEVTDESWRIIDSAIVIRRSKEQVARAMDVVRVWKRTPPPYEVRSLVGNNCQDFVDAVLRGAGMRLPSWWSIRPWPGMYARAIEKLCGHETLRIGNWQLQPKPVTARMAASAPTSTALPGRMGAYLAQIQNAGPKALAPA